jgi:hypothetical protein
MMKKEESEAVRTIFESYFDQYSLRVDIVNCSTLFSHDGQVKI